MVDSASVHMSDNGNNIELLGDGITESFGMTGLFHRQLGSTLGIPAKYYDRLRSELPFLLASNVNGWLGIRGSRQLVRTMDGDARAFLSDRYRRIDNYEIAEATLPVLSEITGVTIESCEVTDNRMYIKAVNPRLETEILPGDIVQADDDLEPRSGLGSGRNAFYTGLSAKTACINDLATQIPHRGRARRHMGAFRRRDNSADDAPFMSSCGTCEAAAVRRINSAADSCAKRQR